MLSDRDFALGAMLARNYFPSQKEDFDEIPPVLHTEELTPAVAKLLADRTDRRNAYDVANYRITRFNGVSRTCNLPHPGAYSDLAVEIHKQWSKIEPLIRNPRSVIQPRRHRDGRIVVMDYETSSQQESRYLSLGFGKKYVVHSDIANCFPSTYSHAIAWAAVGKPTAKKNQRRRNTWYNTLDRKSRAVTRNETNGLPIGPATSNVLLEMILSRVDEAVSSEFPDFVRYIDDYTAFARSDEEAGDFIVALQRELAHYGFELSFAKTKTERLPAETTPRWVSELVNTIPRNAPLKPADVHAYMHIVQRLAAENPDGSVVKFGLKTIATQAMQADALVALANHSISLAFHFPIVLPYFLRVLEMQKIKPTSFVHLKQVKEIIRECAKRRRSDGVAWGLYILFRMRRSVGISLATEIIETGDCVSITMLLLFQEQDVEAAVLTFASAITGDPADHDPYWLLLYELSNRTSFATAYTRDSDFKVLRNAGVKFLDDAR